MNTREKIAWRLLGDPQQVTLHSAMKVPAIKKVVYKAVEKYRELEISEGMKKFSEIYNIVFKSPKLESVHNKVMIEHPDIKTWEYFQKVADIENYAIEKDLYVKMAEYDTELNFRDL